MRESYQYRGMPKLVVNDSFDYGMDSPLATIIDDPSIFKKTASSKVAHEWGEFEPIPGYSIIHLIANGATEFTGNNRNGDAFSAAFCRSSHPTFKKHGALYRHHINRDYSKRDGDILATAYSEDMGRNELAVAASHDKCADWLTRMERGEKIAFSMGFDCFDPSTLVKTSTGDKRIDNIQVGDLVLTHSGQYRPVLRVIPSIRGDRTVLKITTEVSSLLPTNDHEIFVLGSDAIPVWKKAEEISIDDCLTAPDTSGEVSIRAVKFTFDGFNYIAYPINEIAIAEYQPETVYCLTVAEDHSFVAEGAIVHNCDYDVCSICGNKAPTRADYCSCVRKNASYPYGMNRILPDGRKCYVDNPSGVWNDISYVGTGADMIAQHLRKIASFDDVIGGAELGEMYIRGTQLTSNKIALAHKLSNIEKFVPAISFKDRGPVRISQKVANHLRDSSPRDMFGELASINCVLSFREFYKIAMGDMMIGEFSDTLDAVEPHVSGYWSNLVASPDRLTSVCSNNSYDCSKTAAVLNDYERTELVNQFSVDPELASHRLMKQADCGEICDVVMPLNHQGQILLDEYMAYKLAALENCAITVDDAVAAIAIMTS